MRFKNALKAKIKKIKKFAQQIFLGVLFCAHGGFKKWHPVPPKTGRRSELCGASFFFQKEISRKVGWSLNSLLKNIKVKFCQLFF